MVRAEIVQDRMLPVTHEVVGTVRSRHFAEVAAKVSGRILELPVDLIRDQLDAVFDDLDVAAAKTGMLSSSAIIETVADVLAQRDFKNLVVDPVMVSKSGFRLLRDDAIATLVRRLLPRARVVTPNLHEAALLVESPLTSLDDMARAAEKIASFGPRAVVVKGGHFDELDVVDLLYDGRDFHEFRHDRQQTRHTHGTGCTFAAAIAANLALGHALVDAVARATDYLAGAIRHGIAIGKGHGPLDHFWQR